MSQGSAVPMLTLKEILEVENDYALLDFVCEKTGVLVWPTIRNQFFRLVMSDLLYKSRPLLDTTERAPVLGIAKMALRATLHNILNRPKRARILVRATGAGLIEKEGFSFNRYTGYFADLLDEDAWHIEDLSTLTWPKPRKAANLSYSTPAAVLMRLHSTFSMSERQKRTASQIVDLVGTRARSILGWEIGSERSAWLRQLCARRLAAYPRQQHSFEMLLKKTQPEIFLVEEGCYGHMAVFNSVARANNVIVCEFQHGAVSAGHDVYNVACALEKSHAYQNTLPDYFLAYGSWWTAQFNAPVEKIAIGNPHRASILSSLERSTASKRILILGDGRELDSHLVLCREIAKLLSGQYEVTFRPHPEERKHVLEMDASTFQNFSIDREPDIYTSLASSYAVVAEVSTGLFDAIGITPHILIWDTDKSRFGLTEHPFTTIRTAADVMRNLERASQGSLPSFDATAIWEDNWQSRFKCFLDRLTHSKGTDPLSQHTRSANRNNTINL